MVGPRFIDSADDRRDQWVFFGFFGVGLVSIGLLRYLFGGATKDGVIPPQSWLPLIAAVAVIFGYVWYILISKDRTSISLDRAGDNAYYLGLIFTLFSLGWSLTALSYDENLKAERILDLLPDFGLALACTIVGITARIFVQQFRHDPADIESQARYELGLAIQELRTSMLTAVNDMRNTSTATNIALNDMITEITETQMKSSKGNAEVMNDMIAEITGTMKRSTEKNAEAMDEVSSNLKRLGNECASQVESMTLVANELTEQVKTVGQHLHEQVGLLDINTVPVNKKLKELTDELENTRITINSLAENYGNFTGNIAEASNRIGRTFPESLSNEIAETGKIIKSDLEKLLEQTNKLATEIESQRGYLREDPVKSRLKLLDEDTKSVHRQLETLDFTVVSLRGQLENIDISEQLRYTQDETIEKYNQLKEYLNALETSIRDVTTVVGQVSSSERVVTDYISMLRNAIQKIRDASDKI